MHALDFVLYLVALILFVLTAVGIPSPPRLQLLAAGLAFWVAVPLLDTYRSLGK